MSELVGEPKVRRLGVAGWPVSHSLSPAMQNAALEAVGLGSAWQYQLLPLTPELFTQAVRALPASGFRGINVTIPHKTQALAIADERSARAAAIGAANTLIFERDGVRADNTDAPALIDTLQHQLQTPLAGRQVTVLGAGGSARAAVWALADAGAARIEVVNRTAARAQELCRTLPAEPATRASSTEILINCTAVGLHPDDTLAMLELPDATLNDAQVIVDFVYSAHATPLQQAARSLGKAFIGGLELLVAQGAESFQQFTGVPAPVEVMRDAVNPARVNVRR